MTVHLLKNKTEDIDHGKQDLYEQNIPDANFIPIFEYVAVEFDALISVLGSDSFTSIIVTSQRAVDVLKDALTKVENSAKVLTLPVYTVGPATADRLRLVGFKNVIGEDTGNGQALATKMINELQTPEKFLFLAGKVHRPLLPYRLIESGHSVTTQIVYETKSLDFLGELKSSLKAGDWIVFFSPSFTREILPLLNDTIKVAAIGPTTRQHLEDNYIKVDAMAESPTAESLAEAMAAAGDASGEASEASSGAQAAQ